MDIEEDPHKFLEFTNSPNNTHAMYSLSVVKEDTQCIQEVLTDDENLPHLNIEAKKPKDSKDFEVGRRLIDVTHFLKSIQEIGTHGVMDCGVQHLKITSEKRIGLESKFTFQCEMCNMKFYINNVDDVIDINTAAVAGGIGIGCGFSQLEEFSAALNLPLMSSALYQKHHEIASNHWEKAARDSMREAAEEEKQLAITEGRVNKDGVPIIDVIADGCWSKRSYKKNYSALSGAAAIIGRKTGKILFLGVKNKYCSICTYDESRSAEPRKHTCFKNFSGASTAMESAILVEGFQTSIEMHGLIYGRLISDGDSSTYSKILESRPYSNYTVEKIECRNHLLRNFSNNLEKLKTDTKFPLRYRQTLTAHRMKGFRFAILKCINHLRSLNENHDFSTHQLFEDIQCLHLHIYGNHSKCKAYFCDPTRYENKDLPNDFFMSSLWQKVCFLINNLAGHARSLVHNVSSNVVECFHNVVAKFVGGKRVNFSARGSYKTRCTASAVTFNNKRKAVTVLYKTIVGSSPKGRLNSLEKRKEAQCRKIKKIVKYKKRTTLTKEDTANYGEESLKPDVSDEILEKMKENFVNSLRKTEEERRLIERKTVLQGESSEWLELRRSLITASNFGRIIKMRPSTSCATTVKQLLYKHNIEAESINHGKKFEKIAIQQLATQEGVNIRPCGLFIDPETPFLGASPDGLIGDEWIVEIKCPITAYKGSLEEAIASKKVNFWIKNKKGDLIINKSHNWWYQVQGQLHVTRKNKCMFGVWSGEQKNIKTEVILRDNIFFNTQMMHKLRKFYYNCILPELVDPRHTRNMPIRNPKYIEEKIKKK